MDFEKKQESIKRVVDIIFNCKSVKELMKKINMNINENYTKEQCYIDILIACEFNPKIISDFIINILNSGKEEEISIIINNLNLVPSYILIQLFNSNKIVRDILNNKFNTIFEKLDEESKMYFIEKLCDTEKGKQILINQIPKGLIKDIETRSKFRILRILHQGKDGDKIISERFEDFFQNGYDMWILEELLKDGLPEEKVIKNKSKILNNSYGNNIISFIKWFNERGVFQDDDISLKDFIKSLYNNIEDNKTLDMLEIFYKELLEKQNLSIKDIESLGEGQYSKAYKIGSFVLKTGEKRMTNTIPYHRRILQPLIRQETNPNSENNIFIEIQNIVDTKWNKEMSTIEEKEELYRIYKEIRDKGIVWTDVQAKNIGRLIKPNRTNYITESSITEGDRIKTVKQELEVSDKSVGIIDRKQEETLTEGELVILDTDYLFKVDDININQDLEDEDQPLYIFYEKIYRRQKENGGKEIN